MGLLDRFRKPKPANTRTTTAVDTPYRAVEIVCDPDSCCAAARSIAGHRFLSNSAPLLPLRECDARECQCAYKRYNDRRTDVRRASDEQFDIIATNRDGEERREFATGRRESD